MGPCSSRRCAARQVLFSSCSFGSLTCLLIFVQNRLKYFELSDVVTDYETPAHPKQTAILPSIIVWRSLYRGIHGTDTSHSGRFRLAPVSSYTCCLLTAIELIGFIIARDRRICSVRCGNLPGRRATVHQVHSRPLMVLLQINVLLSL